MIKRIDRESKLSAIGMPENRLTAPHLLYLGPSFWLPWLGWHHMYSFVGFGLGRFLVLVLVVGWVQWRPGLRSVAGAGRGTEMRRQGGWIAGTSLKLCQTLLKLCPLWVVRTSWTAEKEMVYDQRGDGQAHGTDLTISSRSGTATRFWNRSPPLCCSHTP